MRQIKALLLITLLNISSSSLTAEPWYDEPAGCNFYYGGGYRRDDFKYNFSGVSDDPDTLAVFRWKELQSYQVFAEYNYRTTHDWYFRFYGDYGNILSGHNTHAEYASDGKTDEYSKTHSNADRGQVWDASGAFGHIWVSDDGRFSFAPLVGYSFHEQRLHILGGEQTYNPEEEVLGRIPSLRGRSYSEWSSPWFGLDMLIRLQCNVTLRFGGEWHYLRYQSTGYWRMDDMFDVHWRSKAFGYGATAFFGFDVDLCQGWSVGLYGNYRHFYTRQGHYDSTVKYDTVPGQIFGTISTVDDVNLNRATWNTYSASACASYRF